MRTPRTTVLGVFIVLATAALADEPLYRYEGDVLPYPDGGWHWGGCIDPCSESIENGRFVLRWGKLGRIINYDRVIGDTPKEIPPSLWIEWRLRSNVPIPQFADDCDARFSINYRMLFDVVYPFGDAIVSFSGDDWLLGLALDEFHTFRFESPNGVNYWFSVDGVVFYETYGNYPDEPFAYLQFGGGGGCGETRPPDPRNEWDYIRYGTIGYGEEIVSTRPPGTRGLGDEGTKIEGYVDAREWPALDRFVVHFDAANYVYVDEISVEVVATEPRSDEGHCGPLHDCRGTERGAGGDCYAEAGQRAGGDGGDRA